MLRKPYLLQLRVSCSKFVVSRVTEIQPLGIIATPWYVGGLRERLVALTVILHPGKNNFSVWGSSCVLGKQREDLPDYSFYQVWLQKQRSAKDIEVGLVGGWVVV